MKLVTFVAADTSNRIGAVVEGGKTIVDFQAVQERTEGRGSPFFADMLALIDGGEAALALAERSIETALQRKLAPALLNAASTKLLAPVPVPRQMRDCLSFEKHLVQARERRLRKQAAASADPKAALEKFMQDGQAGIPQVWYEQPIYYKGNRFTVIGTDATVVWPRASKYMDYELEFGLFIGRKGKNIRQADARAHIFGYTIFNDFSARDIQGREMQGMLGPAKGKDFDTGNAMGPWLVTADEIPDPYALTMTARINGEEWSRGSSGEMHHKFERILEHISADETLYPGEFIGSGTVGNGCGLELGRELQDGDVVELSVDGLGTLRNKVTRQA